MAIILSDMYRDGLHIDGAGYRRPSRPKSFLRGTWGKCDYIAKVVVKVFACSASQQALILRDNLTSCKKA